MKTLRALQDAVADVLLHGSMSDVEWQKLQSALVESNEPDLGLPPLDTAGVLWVAAIDLVPIEERVAWVKTLEERVAGLNEIRSQTQPDPNRCPVCGNRKDNFFAGEHGVAFALCGRCGNRWNPDSETIPSAPPVGTTR